MTPIISLWQPWGNWVALGWKTIETRTHRRFQSLKGKRVGIHLSLKWDASAMEQAGEYLNYERIAATKRFLRIGGAVICTAFVRDFRELTADDSRAAMIDCGNTKRYGLILEDPQTIESIPMRGKQGIWYADLNFDPVSIGKEGTEQR